MSNRCICAKHLPVVETRRLRLAEARDGPFVVFADRRTEPARATALGRLDDHHLTRLVPARSIHRLVDERDKRHERGKRLAVAV